MCFDGHFGQQMTLDALCQTFSGMNVHKDVLTDTCVPQYALLDIFEHKCPTTCFDRHLCPAICVVGHFQV